MPYKKVKGWAWESFWITGGLFSWLIVPPLAAWLTVPGFMDIIKSASAPVIGHTFQMGLLWGIGGLTYGLGVRYLGVALGSSIILGLCSVFGALVPAVYYHFNPVAGKDTIGVLVGSRWGLMVLVGLAVCVVGIVICGKAGGMKDKELVARKGNHLDAAGTEFKLGLGLILAVVSGLLSACFSFGIEAGGSMAVVANDLWKAAHPGQGEFLYRNNVVFVVILWGGLTTNLVWCFILNMRHKSFHDYTDRRTPLLRNYLLCALGGTTWFLQFFFYGMGESKLGNGASSWILHMSFIILVANAWGIVLGEWKNTSGRTKRMIAVGIVVILLSVLLVGYGNSIKEQTILNDYKIDL